jgi:hypothetical protein
MRLFWFPRDRYPASPLAHWLLPSNGLGADLQKTSVCFTSSIVVWRHRARVNVPSARCIATVRARTYRKHCSCIVGRMRVAGVSRYVTILSLPVLNDHVMCTYISQAVSFLQVYRQKFCGQLFVHVSGLGERIFIASNRFVLSPVPRSYC